MFRNKAVLTVLRFQAGLDDVAHLFTNGDFHWLSTKHDAETPKTWIGKRMVRAKAILPPPAAGHLCGISLQHPRNEVLSGKLGCLGEKCSDYEAGGKNVPHRR